MSDGALHDDVVHGFGSNFKKDVADKLTNEYVMPAYERPSPAYSELGPMASGGVFAAPPGGPEAPPFDPTMLQAHAYMQLMQQHAYPYAGGAFGEWGLPAAAMPWGMGPGGIAGGMPAGAYWPAGAGGLGGRHGGPGNGGRKPKKAKSPRERQRRGRKQQQGAGADAQQEAEKGQRSPKLEALLAGLKAGKARPSLDEVLEQVVELAQDKAGSAWLQENVLQATKQLLDSKDPAEKARKPELALTPTPSSKEELDAVIDGVLKGVLGESSKLANDACASHVLQKLFDVCGAEQKKLLVEALSQPAGNLLKLSKEPSACRVVQKALQMVPRDQQVAIAKHLEKDVIGLIEDQNGNHVIQKCVEQMPPEAVDFIIAAIDSKKNGKDHVASMANHVYGCRVIQRLLEHCSAKQLESICSGIVSEVEKLSMNQYGNYVIQHILEHGTEGHKRTILQSITRNILQYSENKASSNVVEKCLEISYMGEHAQQLDDDRRLLIQAFTTPMHIKDEGLKTPLEKMTSDRFGNYIVQRMLEYCKGDEKATILAAMKRAVLSGKVKEPVVKHLALAHNRYCMNEAEKIPDHAYGGEEDKAGDGVPSST